jgi:dihydrofolate synthase/folylpolyglutamate synthase
MSSSAGIDPNVAAREAALQFLYGRIDYERTPPTGSGQQHFKLDRMRQLMARLGTPYQDLRVIHVAGTKGKGSTATMIGAVLTKAGHRTGVFTSPHLDRVEERIAVDGCPCSAAELVGLVDRLRPAVAAMDGESGEAGGPTYFEITTAMALVYFVDKKVAAAVLEVGLGGRLDSTNVCHPRVAVITSISFDHTRQLGSTLELIATEKAGIIKPDVPVVSGVTAPEPREVIRSVCRRHGCRLAELGVDFDYVYRPPKSLETVEQLGRIDFRHFGPEPSVACDEVPVKMAGKHQAANAAVALAVVVELRRQGWDVPDRAVREGLAEASCPARVELVARRPAVIIDAAHNVASVEALLGVLAESFSARRRLLVFATTREKDARGMLSRLAACFDDVIFTRYLSNPRAVPPEELEAIAAELSLQRVRVCGDPASAWTAVREMAGVDDLVCVTGSFFLAAEMRLECRTRPIFAGAVSGG